MAERLGEDLERIDGIPLSVLLRHDDVCCLVGRRLVLRQLMSHRNLGSRLSAVPQLIRWAPTAWPLRWCELAGENMSGDCGVHADVAGELLKDAGVLYQRARAALLVEPTDSRHWRTIWRRSEASEQWIGDLVVHHEVIRIGERWWDPTEARWFSGPGSTLSDGRVVAIRNENGPWALAPAV